MFALCFEFLKALFFLFNANQKKKTLWHIEIDVTPVRIHRKADGAEAYVEFYSIGDADKGMTRQRVLCAFF